MENPFRLQVKFWGVRGSIPTPQAENLQTGGNTTCLEVRGSDGQVLIIDGGSGLRYLGVDLTRAPSGPALSLKILMTHFHWDHIQGIPLFAPLYDPVNEVTFYSDRPPRELREILEGQMANPYFPVKFEHMAARRHFEQIEGETRFGELRVRPFPLHHPQGACGYRIETQGAAIVHASDLEHGDQALDRVLRENAEDADVLIYDAQYTPDEYGSKRGCGHSTWKEGVCAARDARVKRLVLFHHDPGHDDCFMENVESEARRHFENTAVSRERVAIRIV